MLKTYPKNRFESMVETLKMPENRELPIVIYGANHYAQNTLLFLEKLGINVDCFLVNRFYVTQNTTNGKPIQALEDYLAENECAVVVARGGYKYDQIPEECRQNIKYLFDYDFIGRTVMPENFENPIDEKYLSAREKDVDWVYHNLADEKSEKALDDFIYQRIYGNYAKDFDENQYFAEDIIQLTGSEVFIDCGAYHGETLQQYVDYAKSKGIYTWEKLIAFEPEPENIQIMKQNIRGIPKVQFEQAGVFSHSTTLYVNSGDGSSSAISETGDCSVQVKAIDDVLDGEKATFIKMDIEGSEMEALIGAQNTIRRYKPKLAICIYHKREDFIDIPQYIKSLRDDYKIYVRNYDRSGLETVLYAI